MDGATVVSCLDPVAAAADAEKFRIPAKDRGYSGFEWEKEGEWKGSFCFVQAADTQFGMIDSFGNRNKTTVSWDEEVRLTEKAVEGVNRLRPRPRFFVICGDLVDAMPGVSYKGDQIRDLKAVLSQLHPDIPPVCVCGNHDIGDVPTPQAIQEYQRDFGDDYFSFWVGGVKFVVINSQFYHDASFTQDLKSAQDSWLTQQLHEDNPRKHLIGLQHIPPFVAHPDEEEVNVPGNAALKFNFQDKEVRRNFLTELKNAGMSKLFCGHYHRNAGGWDEGLEVVVTSAIGCQLGKDTHGLRIVRVGDSSIDHEYYSLDSIPQQIELS